MEGTPQARERKDWPPEGFVAVGDYAFSKELVPTQEQVEDAEIFIFARPEFAELEERQRRLSVTRLAIAAAHGAKGALERGRSTGIVPLYAPGFVAIVESIVHEGSVITSYYSQQEYGGFSEAG